MDAEVARVCKPRHLARARQHRTLFRWGPEELGAAARAQIILARPLGMGLSLKAAFNAGVSGATGIDLPGDPYARPADWDAARVIEDPGTPPGDAIPSKNWPSSRRRCLTANEPRLQQRGHRNVHTRRSLADRRCPVTRLYPDLYEERNFERRWHSFIYRYTPQRSARALRVCLGRFP